MQVKHEPFYYWRRMEAEFSSCGKGCNVSYGMGHLSLRYHDTTVASWYLDSGEIVLRHGGWLTYYTKERINRFLSVLDIGASLSQARKVWYVTERQCPRPRGASGVWCTLEGFEDEPAEYTLATRLEGARDTTAAEDCTSQKAGVPINEASSVPPASNASNPLGSRQNE